MCPSLSSILRGPSACIITSSSPPKVSKSARNKLKNYLTLTKVPEKESKVGFRRHKLISMFYRRNSMRVRISFADSTRRNNRYRQSFGWIHPTNETNLFALWFSFFTQEQRPFYHDKTVNIKPSKPPCFKKPLTVLRAGSCVLSHCFIELFLHRFFFFLNTPSPFLSHPMRNPYHQRVLDVRK